MQFEGEIACMDGLEVLRQIGRRSAVPVIMLAGREASMEIALRD
jgi:DNA-binding response OmpR family regulator